MKKLLLFTKISTAILVAAAATITSFSPAAAVTGGDWRAGRIIDDATFYNNSSMSVAEIQQFLNSKVQTCDTWGNKPFGGGTRASYGASVGYPPPYTCVKDYYENTTTRENNLQGRPIPAGAKSAATIIWEAAQRYTINPQVLIVLLQKEQSIITDEWPFLRQYQKATGYACPDTAPCDTSYYGFYNQVESAAWQFRRYATFPNNYNHVPGRLNNVRINPQSSCGSTQVFIENQATASLYNYTPYQPNQAALNNINGTGDACSSYGNRNFWREFNNWFGSTYASPYDYQFITSWGTTNYNPGGTGSVAIIIKNTGSNTWYSDNNLPAGKQPMRLATIGYQNSPFADTSKPGWLGTRNQIRMQPDVVAPGETAMFSLDFVAPYHVGSFSHRLVPVVGGAFLKDIGMNVVTNTHQPAWNPINSTIETRTPLPNQSSHFTLTVQNNSASTWYSDNNLPAGKQPTRLATVGYQNSPFADTADPAWMGTRNQIKMTPDVVTPGQTATFEANFIGPISTTSTQNTFHFVMIVGGVFTHDMGLKVPLSTPAANFSYEGGAGGTNPPVTMSPGQTATVTYAIKNTGNVVWKDESFEGGAHSLRFIMTQPLYRTSSFYDSSDSRWLSSAQIKKTSGTTMPGETATFTFTWKAPPQTGVYREPFQIAIGGLFYPNLGTVFNTTVQ